MPTKPLSRRAVLRGAGGITLGLPYLQAMTAFGQSAPAPIKRLVLCFSPQGTLRTRWRPIGTGTAFTLANLNEILAPLDPLKAKLLVLDGIRMASSYDGPGDGGHANGMAGLWTGTPGVRPSADVYGGGISIDQHVANRVSVDGAGKPVTALKSLELMVGRDEQSVNLNRMIYTGPGKFVTAEKSPEAAFNTALAGVSGGGGSAPNPLTARRKSVLDAVLQDYRALKAKLSGDDRARLDKHLTAIEDIEARLSLGSGPVGAGCAPSPPEPVAFLDNKNFPQVSRLHADVMAMALACDRTRVGSIQWSRAASRIQHAWAGVPEDHHKLAHLTGPTVEGKLATIQKWYAGELAYFLRTLDGIQEGDRTLLDNTVVCWGNELSNGDTHERDPIPFVLAGSCAGHFRTGRYLDFGTTAHNKLLVSLQQAMGVNENTFGSTSYGTGPLAGLT